jgi:hypothetical protein
MPDNNAPAGTFLSVDICPRHGFAMLSMMTLDDSGTGGGTRLLGPKSCCAERREVARWRVSADDRGRIAESVAPSAPPAPAPATEWDELERLARDAKMGSWWFPVPALVRDGFHRTNAEFIAACSPGRVGQLVAAARQLAWIRERCHVVFYPGNLAYPIEHTLAARKDQWATITAEYERENYLAARASRPREETDGH